MFKIIIYCTHIYTRVCVYFNHVARGNSTPVRRDVRSICTPAGHWRLINGISILFVQVCALQGFVELKISKLKDLSNRCYRSYVLASSGHRIHLGDRIIYYIRIRAFE